MMSLIGAILVFLFLLAPLNQAVGREIPWFESLGNWQDRPTWSTEDSWYQVSRATRSAPIEVYNRLFPYYIETCALTQLREYKLDRPGCPFRGDPRELAQQPLDVIKKCVDPGGWGGHIVMFLKGACLDKSVSYPRLKVCPEGTDLTDVDTGVGISVDRGFKNVNWVAFAGRKFFFDGNLRKDVPLGREALDRLIGAIATSGHLKGVQLLDEELKLKPSTMSESEWMARFMLGTDFAVTWGRTNFCNRLPVQRDVLSAIISHLNAKNDHYQSGAVDFKWDPVNDNCGTILHNALAEAGIIAKKRAGLPYWYYVLNLNDTSQPSIEILDYLRTGNSKLLEDVPSVYRDREFRIPLDRYNWLPTRPGNVAAVYDMYPQNTVFMRGRDPLSVYFNIVDLFLGLQIPGTKSVRDAFFTEPKYFDLAENLTWFETRYEKTLEAIRLLKIDGRFPDPAELPRQRVPRSFLNRYEKYIQEEIAETRRLKTQL